MSGVSVKHCDYCYADKGEKSVSEMVEYQRRSTEYEEMVRNGVGRTELLKFERQYHTKGLSAFR